MKKDILLILICVVLLGACGPISGLFGKKEEAVPQGVAVEIAPDQNSEPLYKYNVAVILPNGHEQKWSSLFEYIVDDFVEIGYGCEVLFADDDAERQARLVDDAVEKRVNCIVIAPVDSYSSEIRKSLETAKSMNIAVIAYDRLVMDTESVDCYVAFDPYLSGRQCAQAIREALDFSDGPCNIELFMPSKSDGSSKYFYHGAMDVLMPLIDSGRINVPSGETSLGLTGTEASLARVRMDALIGDYYAVGRRLDAVLTVDDGVANTVIEELESRGYGLGGQFPIITGGGCYLDNVLKIIEGRQRMSLYKDERVISAVLAETADLLSHNAFPSVMDTVTFDNGKKIVPAVLVEPVLVNVDNYKELLIGGDYYSYRQLNQE